MADYDRLHLRMSCIFPLPTDLVVDPDEAMVRDCGRLRRRCHTLALLVEAAWSLVLEERRKKKKRQAIGRRLDSSR